MTIPTACSLAESDRSERESTIRALFANARRVTELDDGFEARFEGDAVSIRQVCDLIALERECCRFLRFDMTAEPDRGPITLRVTGPDGAGDVTASWLPDRLDP